MNIRLTSKVIYGTTKYYPVNPLATIMTKLLGQKTLTISDIRLLSKHFTFIVDGIESGFISTGQHSETTFMGLAKE